MHSTPDLFGFGNEYVRGTDEVGLLPQCCLDWVLYFGSL